MIRSIFYKEWIKLRWPVGVLAVLAVAMLINTWLSMMWQIKFREAHIFWVMVITGRQMFYQSLMYFPILAGAIVAAFQYIPEIHQHRLKLSLRLPMKESFIIFLMMSFGFLSLVFLYSFLLLGFILISSLYLPVEMLGDITVTFIPWMLGGFCSYFLLSTVIIEPTWLRRLVLVLITFGLVQTFLLAMDSMGRNVFSYVNSLPFFLIVTILAGFTVYYAVHRYQRGVE